MDPSTVGVSKLRSGRYLQPEPMLQRPGFGASMAERGRSAPSYAYALNNPVHFVDRSGRVIGVMVDDSSQSSDTARLVQLLNDARTDLCSRDLLAALDNSADLILIRSGTGQTETTVGQTGRRAAGLVSVTMDSEYLQFGDTFIGTGMETFIHELYHALILSELGKPDMDADSQHLLINGVERTGHGKRVRHANLKSLMDQWKQCKEKCGMDP